MADKKASIEEYDDGSSLEKNFEFLDKDNPEYASQRESLIEKMRLQKKELEKLHKQITVQRKELKAIMSGLRKQAAAAPQDESIQDLIAETRQDQEFLTRAFAEVASCKGRWNIDRAKLQASKDFNTPLDINVITEARLKPLPSSEITHKKEAKQQFESNSAHPSKRTKGNVSSTLKNNVGKKIMGLRLQTGMQRSISQYSRQRQPLQNTRMP